MSCQPHEMNAHATVLAHKNGQIELAVVRQSACKACAEKAACGAKKDELKPQRIWLNSTAPLPAGSEVQLAIADASVLRAAGLMYGLPLTGFMAGLLGGSTISDLSALLGGLLGLGLGFGLAGLLARRLSPAFRLITTLGDKK